MIERWYSEQYLLAAYVLARGSLFDIVLPNGFVSDDDALTGVMAPLWDLDRMRGVGRRGSSFWIRMK